MFAIKSEIVWFFIFIHVSNSERRIQEGIDVTAEKKYVVYLVKAPLSDSGYDFWLCGGALVTSDFVVTSAACIKDVDYLYVIAGYKKYVVDDEIETDPCTSKKKKKVIYTCYPDGYELKYERLDTWSLIDIGVAKVESPYDFEDQTFKTLCSYIPGAIAIGYDAKHQEPKTDAVVFGWGHTMSWRKEEDRNNYNQETLKYAPVMIIDKEECKVQYEEYGQMIDVIDTYMICTLGGGQLNDFGERIDSTNNGQIDGGFANGCARRKSWATNPENPIDDCDEFEEGYEYDETRRQINESNPSMSEIRNINNINKTRVETIRTTQSNRTNRTALSKTTTSNNKPIKRTKLTNRTVSFKKPFLSNKTNIFNETVRDARRYGICQNDHGGPLVTWVGAHEVLIGVASVFKVADDFKCAGPFLYTSTQCNGAFLDCILAQSNFDLMKRATLSDNSHRRSFCRKSEDDERHATVERHISWLSHPAGPADHERHLKNPDAKERGRNEKIVNESEGNVNLANTKNPQNERYPLNKKSSVNVDHAPNRFKINNAQNAPSVNENNAPNKNYEASLQHGPVGIPMMKNDKYSPNIAPVSNKGPFQESMKRFKLSYKPKTIFKHAQKNEQTPSEPAQNNMPASNYRPDYSSASNNMPKPSNKNEAPIIERTQSNGAKLQLRQQVPLNI